MGGSQRGGGGGDRWGWWRAVAVGVAMALPSIKGRGGDPADLTIGAFGALRVPDDGRPPAPASRCGAPLDRNHCPSPSQTRPTVVPQPPPPTGVSPTALAILICSLPPTPGSLFCPACQPTSVPTTPRFSVGECVQWRVDSRAVAGWDQTRQGPLCSCCCAARLVAFVPVGGPKLLSQRTDMGDVSPVGSAPQHPTGRPLEGQRAREKHKTRTARCQPGPRAAVAGPSPQRPW